jgi:2-hydroxychromene-2-carboxylate isomerase
MKERLREATASAEARGIFGVPTFVVGEELFWGQDRLAQVGHALAGWHTPLS